MPFCISCSAHIDPSDFDMDEVAAPAINISKAIAIRPNLTGTKERVLPLAGASAIVNEDEFTKVLTDKIGSALKNKNYPVVADSHRAIEIQVVRVSLQPTSTMYCVIDYNLKLGDGKYYGFQSSNKNWSFKTACENALQNAANDILNAKSTVEYLQRE